MTFGNNGSINPQDCNYDGKESAADFVAKLWNRREGNSSDSL
jgi:hypothetical protein